MKNRISICSLLALLFTGFALPCSAFIPTDGTFYGLFFQTNTYWQNSSGTIRITTRHTGSYSANLKIGSRSYSYSGTLASDGSAVRQILRSYDYPVWVYFQVSPLDPDVITGTVSDGYWDARLDAERAVFNSNTNPCPYQGTYTMVLHGDFSSTQVPGGASGGTIKINPSGSISLTEYLADGTKFGQSTTLTKNGFWPLFYAPYSGYGTFYGWVSFDLTTNTIISGDVNWVKPGGYSSTYYPYGFNVTYPVYGSRYVQPPAGTRILNFTNGMIEFNGQNLYQGITNFVTLDTKNKVQNLSANGLSVTFSLSNGYVSGRVMDPITFAWYPYKGVVVQNANIATGYFTGGYLSGEVWMQGR